MSQSVPDMLLRGSGRRAQRRRPEQPPRRTKRETATALAGVPMFADLPKRHLNRLTGQTDVLSFRAGQTVVKEDDPGETLFVVLAGQGKVVRRGRRVGAVLPGDFFGELSAIDGGRRTASVIAETPLEVLRLFRRTLVALLHEDPKVSLRLLDGIVRRLRQIDRELRR
jgi:CRP/FNR family transcriptional regulator, cyclic AMP receptor protein